MPELASVTSPVCALVLAPLLLGLINRTKAFVAGRRGPPLLQPYFDIAKYLRRGAVYGDATSWVFPLGPVPQNIGDLLAGESTNIAVRYQFTLINGPCKLVILGCQFDTKVSVSMPDALDKADTPPPSRTNSVTAPTFPPPL